MVERSTEAAVHSWPTFSARQIRPPRPWASQSRFCGEGDMFYHADSSTDSSGRGLDEREGRRYARAGDFRGLGNWKLHRRTIASLGFLPSGRAARARSRDARSLRSEYCRVLRKQGCWSHLIRSDLSLFPAIVRDWPGSKGKRFADFFCNETAHR